MYNCIKCQTILPTWCKIPNVNTRVTIYKEKNVIQNLFKLELGENCKHTNPLVCLWHHINNASLTERASADYKRNTALWVWQQKHYLVMYNNAHNHMNYLKAVLHKLINCFSLVVFTNGLVDKTCWKLFD